MRSLQLTLIAAALVLAVGCTWMRSQFTQQQPKPTGEVKNVTAEQLVGYLNTQASRMQSVTYGDARLVARDHNIPMPGLHGNLAAAQPRNFRLTGQGGAMGGKVDLGSNQDQFWMYVDAPTTNGMFVYASHRDFEDGKAKIPGGIPFEPDWVMQALGMTRFDPGLLYKASTQEKERTYTLSWDAYTPSKVPIHKEVIFDADDAPDPHPQVKKHVIKDSKGKVVCYAEIKSARTFQVGAADPQSARVPIVKYPTKILLRWEEQKFEMDLTLDSAQVNQIFTDEQNRRLFSRPNIPGAIPVDLAHAEFRTK
jgi:hypothetical protein